MLRFTMILTLVFALSGCAHPAGPDMLVIESGTYAAAFAGTIDVLRDEGLRPTLRDPRTGLIEAGPAPASSMLEPWKSDHATFDSALESTIHHQRRRVRIEFHPSNAAVSPPLDHTEATGPFEVRVQAWLERAYEPGQRRNLRSRQLFSEAVIYAPGAVETPVDSQFWLPIRRDAEYESHLRRLLADALKMRIPMPETSGNEIDAPQVSVSVGRAAGPT